jgi:hypothetical protein
MLTKEMKFFPMLSFLAFPFHPIFNLISTLHLITLCLRAKNPEKHCLSSDDSPLYGAGGRGGGG